MRVAEWSGTVTMVRNGDFSYDQTLTQGLKILGEKLV